MLEFVGNQPIDVIGPIPQTFRLAFGNTGGASWVAPFAIFLLIARAIASASLIFTGLTRLPMTASWDHLVPAWFSRLDPLRRTPVNSILFIAVVVMLLIVALFALPLVGALRPRVPGWLKVAAAAGLFASLVSLLIAVYPIVDVVSKAAYATKIASVVLLTNAAGVLLYRAGERRRKAGQ